MLDDTLFPTEISMYDPWVIREILHNCIAHQDYSLASRINVVEEPETLLFTNMGTFIPGSLENVLLGDAPPEHYRNPFLAKVMVNLNMIDTIGSGIRRMFKTQKDRFFPMPDYDLSEHNLVKVRLYGKILNEDYTRLLMNKSNLDLMDVFALDKVQKGKPIFENEFKRLKNLKLIEGRRPNLFVSAKVAAVTGAKADYIKQRAFDKDHYERMVISYLEEFGEARRKEFDDLLLEKFSDVLNHEQKINRVRNLLQGMKKKGIVDRIGSRKKGKWVLIK